MSANTAPYVPATIFRYESDANHFKTFTRPKLEKLDDGKRICAIFDNATDKTKRSLNRFIAKNGFFYLMAAMARGAKLSEEEVQTLEKFFARYEVRRNGNNQSTDSLAVSH